MEDPSQENDFVTIPDQLMVRETVKVQRQRASHATLILVQVCKVQFYVVIEFLRNSKSHINQTPPFDLGVSA